MFPCAQYDLWVVSECSVFLNWNFSTHKKINNKETYLCVSGGKTKSLKYRLNLCITVSILHSA